jgi:hypothetical protein
MRCLEFQEQVQRLLDGEAPLESAGEREHRNACPSCRELYWAARQLRRGLASMPAPVVPDGFAERVVRRVQLRPSIPFRPRVWLAAAASMLVAGLAVWSVWQWLVRPDPEQVVEAPRPPSLRQELAEAGDATLRVSRSFARDAADRASILLPPGELLKAPGLPPAIEPDVTPLRQAGRTVASGLEPVTSSARQAWSMFVRDLPFSERNTP